MAKILLVEDNSNYRKYMQNLLLQNGHSVDSVAGPIEGLEYFELNEYDLVISDLLMEAMDGVKFLSFIKRRNSKIPTMILTGNPSDTTQLQALDIYVDKYLSKDIKKEILLKSIEYLLSLNLEYQEIKDKILISKTDNIKIDLEAHVAYKNGEKVILTQKEFAITSMFLENKGRVLSRDEIIEKIWGVSVELVEPRVIDVHMTAVRKKLKTTAILSIRGIGYKWDE